MRKNSNFLIRYALGVSLLLVGSLNAEAADLYVSNASNDAWDGLAAEYSGGTTGPWKTLNRVNQQMALLEGGSVLFRRGDRFEGTLEVIQNNIRFGAYGEGERPVLSGARYLTEDWSLVAGRNNVYQHLLPSDVEEVSLLLRENTSLPLGRTPNGDLLTNSAFYSFSSRTMTSLTDPELTDAQEMTGAEIVLRKNVWTYYAYQVTSIEGKTINFLNEVEPAKKRGDENLVEAGYFFQKHLNTLDLDGEWFFDKSKRVLFLYSDIKPLEKSFQYSVKPVVVNISGSEAIALQGLKIEMAGSMGIKIVASQKVEVRDCEIALCGQEGIRLEKGSAQIESNKIHDCLAVGIHAIEEGRVVVTKNTLTNIGMIAGRGWASGRLAQRRNGILLTGGNSEASYNRLTNIGYLGIQHLKGRNLIRRNVIDTYNLVTFDGGAIYTHDDQQGSIVEENIIMNGMPNSVGLGDSIGNSEVPFSTGIQLDRKTENLIIRNNTITFPRTNTGPDRGIHLNFNTKDNLILGNTILVRGAGISTLDRDPYERKPGEESPPSMSMNRFEENIIVRTNATNTKANYGALACFSLKETEQCDVETHLNCNPGRPAFERWYNTAAEWNEACSYASGNLDAPVMVDESSAPEDFIQLFYNDSDNPKTFPLSGGAFRDPRGNPVSDFVTLAPWSSVVLFRDQPNIIFILTDDQGYGDLGRHGHPILKTPNLDRLFNESVRFDNFYVSPSCSPTRAALMTGMHEFRNGVTHTMTPRYDLYKGAVTLPELLKSAGYRTGFIGKWHLGSKSSGSDYMPRNRGFDWSSTSSGGVRTFFDPDIIRNGVSMPGRGFREDIYFDEAMSFIKETGDQPFFCYLATYSPHFPLKAPEKFTEPFRDKVVDEKTAAYLGMVSNIDFNVGRLLDFLEECGIAGNTIVIFMNDNGGTWGVDVHNAGMRGCKCTIWQGGTRAISFWRWPGHWKPHPVGSLTAHLDVLPTLCDLAGVTLPSQVGSRLEGFSLVPLLKSDAPLSWHEDRMLFQHLGRWPGGLAASHKYAMCAVRQANYLLVRSRSCEDPECLNYLSQCSALRKVEKGHTKTNYTDTNAQFHWATTPANGWALFNVKKDPACLQNLATTNPERISELAAAYDNWWDDVFPVMLERGGDRGDPNRSVEDLEINLRRP